MGEYEIRILKDDGTVGFVLSEFQLNNTAAIYSARKTAKGKSFEVWRGSERIFPKDQE